ncbi:MAG: HAD family hydrolase [Clostridiaceae bacterium]|nr:HAD family hydrolase [Clostridiaceae bacterium]
MVYPKMIIFDYGHTLLYEPELAPLKGEKALFAYVTENPRGITPEQANEFAQHIFESFDAVRKCGAEIQEYPALKLKNEYLGLKYSVSMEEAEIILWDHMTPGAVMPGADIMLDYINKRGIMSAVISNIGWSGHALTNRLNRLLPDNRFEFVIASSDYAIRKPNRLLFELALRKAGLDASDVWYCGDNPQADVEGAAQAGIYPVWYDNDTECAYRDKARETVPQCKYLYIKEWSEMIKVLDTMSNTLS